MTGRVKGLLRSPLSMAVAVLGIALLAAACGGDEEEAPPVATPSGETPAAESTPSGETPPGEVEIKMVPSIRFDRDELTIPANQDVTITADNEDGSVRHNFAVYLSEEDARTGGEPLARTEICSAPCTRAVTLNLAPGEYFFLCEVHPSQMTGKLVVEGGGAGASPRY